MNLRLHFNTILFCSLIVLQPGQTSLSLSSKGSATVTGIYMHLSAMGVESDRFPSIVAKIDLKVDTGSCSVSYYDPKYSAYCYRLTKEELKKIKGLLAKYDVGKLKKEYALSRTDQPTSYTTFYQGEKQIKVSDYGLEGPAPLKELYGVVYRFEATIQ